MREPRLLMALAAGLALSGACGDDAAVGGRSTGGNAAGGSPRTGAGDAGGNGAGAEGGGTVQPMPNGKYVLAHWMVLMGRWNANQQPASDYEAVLSEMHDYGVDALAVYWDEYDAAATNYAAALDAAEAIDMKVSWATVGYQDQSIKDMIIAEQDRPGVLRDKDGHLVLTGYFNTWDLTQNGDQGFFYDASHGDLAYFDDAGLDYAFWPDLPWSLDETDGERASELGAAGFFKFFYGGVIDNDIWLEKSDVALADATQHGVGFMPGILPFYAAQPSKNFQMFESNGLVGLRDQWRWAIDHDVPAVQIVTANDFNEHTYLQTFGDGGPIVGIPENPVWSGTIMLDHSGFGKLMRRYADWFKTDVEPPIEADEVIIAYRLHPRTAQSFTALPADVKALLEAFRPTNAAPNYFELDYQRLESHDVMDDSVQLCVRLTAPATVTLSAGSTSVTEELPAGETIVVLPGADASAVWNDKVRHTFTAEQFGKPHVVIERAGSTLMDRDAELEIGPYIVPGAYNYYAAELDP